MRDRALSFSRDRGFSWDTGFEDLDNPGLKESGYSLQDIIQSIGRKRTMSGDVNFNFIPMPVDSYEPYPSSSSTDIRPDFVSQSGLNPNSGTSSTLPNRSNVEPNYLNMMPGSHPEMMTMHPMGIHRSALGMDHAHMSGLNMHLLHPLIPIGTLPVHFDEGSIRVGAYTKEERQIRIAKFRAKKNRRVWKKQIKYDCRKKLADNRPRIKGRFVTRKDDDDPDQDNDNGQEREREDQQKAQPIPEIPLHSIESSVDIKSYDFTESAVADELGSSNYVQSQAQTSWVVKTEMSHGLILGESMLNSISTTDNELGPESTSQMM